IEQWLITVVHWSCRMVGSVALMNSTRCPMVLDPYCTKLWNSRPSRLQKQESSQHSTPELAFLLPPILLEVNITPISPFHRISISHPLSFPDLILCTLFSTRLMKFRIEDWRHILWGCTLKTVHNMLGLKISSYGPKK